MDLFDDIDDDEIGDFDDSRAAYFRDLAEQYQLHKSSGGDVFDFFPTELEE